MGSSTGTLTAKNNSFSQFSTGITWAGGATISSNSFSHGYQAVLLTSSQSPVITDNTWSDLSGVPFGLNSSSLDFSTITGNTTNGLSSPTFDLNGDSIATSTTMPALVYQVDQALTVPSGITLTIDPGAVLKSSGSSLCYSPNYGVAYTNF